MNEYIPISCFCRFSLVLWKLHMKWSYLGELQMGKQSRETDTLFRNTYISSFKIWEMEIWQLWDFPISVQNKEALPSLWGQHAPSEDLQEHTARPQQVAEPGHLCVRSKAQQGLRGRHSVVCSRGLLWHGVGIQPVRTRRLRHHKDSNGSMNGSMVKCRELMAVGKHELSAKLRHFLEQNLACFCVINVLVQKDCFIQREFVGGREREREGFYSFRGRVWGWFLCVLFLSLIWGK